MTIKKRLIPRLYFCPDVILIRWLDYEWIIKRWGTDWRFR